MVRNQRFLLLFQGSKDAISERNLQKPIGISSEWKQPCHVQVNYINAHATSTLVGDVAELNAVKKVFSGNVSNLKMNGTKSMTGHSLGAAGGLEGIATVKAIETGWLHPTINLV